MATLAYAAPRTRRHRETRRHFLVYLGLAPFLVLAIFPILWMLITALNGFNLVMAFVALDQDLTVSRLVAMLRGMPLWRLPFDGVPIALGVVPLVFSAALFTLPLARAALRRFQAARVARENGRRAVLRTVITGVRTKRDIRTFEIRLRVDNRDRALAVGMTAYVLLPLR